MATEQTLRELVAIDSVSSRSNEEIISYLEHRCKAGALLTQRFPHVDENGAAKINLVARSKDTGETELALVGHTDTVPYDPNWGDALHLTLRDGKLFGRGACDTKAFIAALLTAVEATDLRSLKKSLALVFTADEEIGCLGAKRLAAANPFTARYAIVGEPTSLRPLRAGKGYCAAEITVRGREAHSAFPQLGSSAIFHAARLIQQIEEISKALREDRHPDFDPPFTTVNIGVIRGGTAKNIIPGECRFTLEWRPIPGQQTGHVLRLVEKAISELPREDRNIEYIVDAARADESFETRHDSPLIQFLEQTSVQTPGTVAFGTEAPSLIALGAEAAVFGPGDIRVAHRTDEFVPVAELEKCVEILGQAIDHFCVKS
jgi:acetylornithine deacetylase